MERITYRDSKTNSPLIIEGDLLYYKPENYRVVIKKEDGTFTDIVRDAIVKIEEIKNES